MEAQTLADSGAHVGSPSADLESLTSQMKAVREAASLLLDKAQNAASVTEQAAALEKAAGALKLAAEMDKTRTELAKLTQEISKLQHENRTAAGRERSERMRDYVALLTPLITIITLAATLIAQNWQFLRSEQNKREEALDAQWQDAVKTISTSGALSPGVVALQPFLRSPKYGEQAREVAVNLLSRSSDPAFFTSLFGTALTPVTWTNVDRLVRLDRELVARGNPIWTKAWDVAKQENNLKKLTPPERGTYDYIETIAPSITSEVAAVLKTPRITGVVVDLSATYFKNGDWSGINFSDVNLENMNLNRMDVRNAELDGVTRFTGAYFYYTAWWEVKSINRPLLDHLKANNPFRPGTAYGLRDNLVSTAQYEAAIQRLTSQMK